MRRLIIVGAPAGLSTPKSQLRCLLEVRPMRAARHALELSHVVRLDLLLVRGLSGECVTAVAASFPQLRHLTITIEAPPPGRLATRAAIAAAPGVSPTFFPALALLGRLDTLIAPAPTLDADWVCVGRLSGLTRLDFGEHWNWTVSPSARLYSLRRLLHLRHLVLPLNMFLFTPPFGLVWAAQLVQLRELHHCPAPCRAGDLRALRALPHLWRLSLEGVDPGFDEAAWGDQGGDDWEATSTLLRDELPAVRELRVLRVVCTKTFHRLLRAWGFPSLELLDAQLSFYQQVHEVEEAVEELGGVVSLLPPTVQRIGVHLVSHQPSEEEDEEEGSGDLADHEDCEVWLDTIKRALQKGVTRVARRVLLIEFVETSD